MKADHSACAESRSLRILTNSACSATSKIVRSNCPIAIAARRQSNPIWPTSGSWRWTELAQSAMDAVSDDRVKIFPTRYRKGYLDWLSEKRDWPVSRQLWWGHRIPIWSATCESQSDADSLVEKVNAITDSDSGQIATRTDRNEDGLFNVFVCLRDENESLERKLESLGLQQDPDVLDTWFSSALWPHSTLGWPEKTAELDYFYPTSTLITSRDIITLWVARMVLMGLNNVGDVPFREVFIHPKILDGMGETMSKSKGNGVDPIDVIDKFGPDALRFGLARLATDTQDVRMPVQYECPHCEKLIDQTKKNRSQPTVPCPALQKDIFDAVGRKRPKTSAHPQSAGRQRTLRDRSQLCQ